MRQIARIDIDENEHVTLLDRVVVNSGAYITQATVTAARIDVTKDDDILWSMDLEPDDIVFDSLQVDGYWEDDQLGYNLRYTLDPTVAPMEGGRSYRVVITLTTSAFGPKYSQWEVKVRDVPSVITW